MIPSKWVPFAAVAVAGALAGILAGWALWRPKPARPETYAPAIRQQDGSLVLERKPQADAKPAAELPKGAKLERQVQVTVQPRPIPPLPSPTGDPATPTFGAPGPLNCPPVRVDLSLVKMPDQTRRVVASSPDGEVVGGLDIPVEPATPSRPLRWAAGGLWNPADRTGGAWIQRAAGPFVFGAQAFQDRTPAGTTVKAHVMVGIRW